MRENRLKGTTLRLPFDQYQRYGLVTDALERPRARWWAAQIPGVGGAGGVILSFLDGNEVTVLDWVAPRSCVRIRAERCDSVTVLATGLRKLDARLAQLENLLA